MRRYLVFVLAVILAAAVIIGCSSGKKGTSPGPTAQEQYQTLKPWVDGIVGDLAELVGRSFDDLANHYPAIVSPPILGRLTADVGIQETIDHVYENGWHIFTASEESDTLSIAVADSIRFTDIGGTPQQEPDEETTNAVRLIQHITLTMSYLGASISLTIYDDLSFTGFQASLIIVDGTEVWGMGLSGSTEYGPTSLDLTFGIDIDDVTVPNPRFGGSGCPREGSFTISIEGSSFGYSEDGQPESMTMRATVAGTFSASGSMQYTITVDGSQFHESLEACEPN